MVCYEHTLRLSLMSFVKLARLRVSGALFILNSNITLGYCEINFVSFQKCGHINRNIVSISGGIPVLKIYSRFNFLCMPGVQEIKMQ